jgi:hypothetical protein
MEKIGICLKKLHFRNNIQAVEITQGIETFFKVKYIE